MTQQKPLRLATTLEEIHEKFENFRTEAGRDYGRAFVPQADDIIISPFAKSGTTWTQQIVHSLRTRGDMDFDEIMDVVPWIEMAYDLGIDLQAPQKAHPRAFKSHMTWDDIPKGARYIYSIRDPRDVIVSDYYFLGGWIFDTSAIDMESFAHDQFLKDNYYWRHINSWWSQYNNPDVLLLCYEDMRRDLPTTIKIIAEFMHIELDAELLAIVTEHASFEFMKAHNRQFDDHTIRDHRNEALGLPAHVTTSKVKHGRVGDHKQKLSPELNAIVDARWKDHTQPEYGLTCYTDVQHKIRARLQAHYAHLLPEETSNHE